MFGSSFAHGDHTFQSWKFAMCGNNESAGEAIVVERSTGNVEGLVVTKIKNARITSRTMRRTRLMTPPDVVRTGTAAPWPGRARTLARPGPGPHPGCRRPALRADYMPDRANTLR